MDTPFNLTQCDKEPVRFINSIQQFGAVLIIDENSQIISYSKNLFEMLGIEPRQILGKKLDPKLLPKESYHLTETQISHLTIIEIEKKSWKVLLI